MAEFELFRIVAQTFGIPFATVLALLVVWYKGMFIARPMYDAREQALLDAANEIREDRNYWRDYALEMKDAVGTTSEIASEGLESHRRRRPGPPR
jgi:hypothetical protein